LSILYAPILMIQQTRAVILAMRGSGGGWAPQRRDAHAYPLRTLLAFHWLETVLGLLLVAGLFAGLISLWLLPIVFSLVLAVPLSALSAVHLGQRTPAALRMESPNSLREPAIFTRAKRERGTLHAMLKRQEQMPAE
jgi:membrane glycosyltransferase